MNDRSRQVVKIYNRNKHNKDIVLYCNIFFLGRILNDYK
nr:MAG TPA: hypothetical protein [Caudoviricetes sp.]